MNPIPPEKIRLLLTDLLPSIRQTADFILGERESFSSDSIEFKSHNDMVSYVDREAEEQLTRACQKLLPNSGFIREEGGDIPSADGYRWIIDPLDGTTNFIHGIPAYCISIALQYQEKTILAVVHDVPRHESFTAIQGEGAFLNGKRIYVSGVKTLNLALLGTGFPYAKNGKEDDFLAVIKIFLSRCHGIRRFGAAALDLAWVAAGRIDGFYEFGLQAWDVAAGALLIKEAGGHVTDTKGTDNYVFGKKIAGSNGHIHAEMLSVVGNLD